MLGLITYLVLCLFVDCLREDDYTKAVGCRSTHHLTMFFISRESVKQIFVLIIYCTFIGTYMNICLSWASVWLKQYYLAFKTKVLINSNVHYIFDLICAKPIFVKC